MSSDNSLRDVLIDAIQDWAGENGGGFPTAFVIALEYVNADGENTLLISQLDNQPTHRSMGLSSYLNAWYKDDAQKQWDILWGQQ